MPTTADCPTYWARIYIAGPIDIAEQICRKGVMEGLCVTVTPTKYIYTGGEETGMIVEIINYPRFPSTPQEIRKTAEDLAQALLKGMYQGSYTIMTPDESFYFSRRDGFR